MRFLRHSDRDFVLIALSAAYGLLVVAAASAPLIAIGIWWTANTVAHNFIHLPFFRNRAANALYSGYLSCLLGLPQTVWRDRHLSHHAGKTWRWRWSKQIVGELIVTAAVWAWAFSRGPSFFVMTWVLGWIGGLALCQVQGYYEHVRGTVSHYGRGYNVLFFNDGYHVEHHARPGTHWSELPRQRDPAPTGSRYPAVFRWLEAGALLELLEKFALRSSLIKRYLIRTHRRAFRRLLARLPEIKRVTVVGGGLFPRTTLVLQELVPRAEITCIELSGENAARARAQLKNPVQWVEQRYQFEPADVPDLLIVPLALVGDRQTFYRDRHADAVIIHDWIWNYRSPGAVISLPLLKCLNLVDHRTPESVRHQT